MNGVNTYLIFDGNCREVMTFYAKCFAAELTIMPFSEEVCGPLPPEAKNRIMHACLTKGGPFLMASDNMPGMPFQQGNNFSINISCDSAEEADRLFGAIGEGGEVKMPLQETFWAARFGMLTDRYGINWMFNLERPRQG